MKKLLLSATLLSAMLNVTAQYQIPNGDFEEWTSFTNCTDAGLDSLNYFFGTSEFRLDETQTGLECNTRPTAIKTTDAYHGNYALRLVPAGFSHLVDLLPSGVSLGRRELHGIPFTGKPEMLTGYYKLSIEDETYANIEITIYSNGEKTGTGQLSINAPASEYTRFELPITYINNLVPTSLFLSISINPPLVTRTNKPSELFVDNLIFEYDLITSDIAPTEDKSLTISVTDQMLRFSSPVSEIDVFTTTGESKLHNVSSVDFLDVSAIQSGVYIIRFNHNGQYQRTKVIVP